MKNVFSIDEQLTRLDARAKPSGDLMESVRAVESGVKDLEKRQRARLARENAATEKFFGGKVPENFKMAANAASNYKPPFIR
jgi:hypothetical protein